MSEAPIDPGRRGTVAARVIDVQSGADAIVRVLQEHHVDVVFGIPGVHTLDLYDALARAESPRHVLVRHEQAAAFAADGYARTACRPGICLTTTGPGAFNVVAALSEAYADSSPVVLLAGQVPVPDIGRERGLLHEVGDQGAVFEPVTKSVWRPRTVEELVVAVGDALEVVGMGRPRPVYVEMPLDLLSGTSGGRSVREPAVPVPPDSVAIAAATDLLGSAQRPVIVAGGGVNRSGTNRVLTALAERLDAPVLMSVNGLGSISSSHRLAAGTLLRRNAGARALLEAADVVLVVGCRLDANTTADWTMRLPDLVHLDVDPRVIGLNYEPRVTLQGSAADLVPQVLDALGPAPTPIRSDGARRADVARRQLIESLGSPQPVEFAAMQELRRLVPDDCILAMDATLMSGWASAFWPVSRPAGLLFPFGGATLGFALPAAIGASFASPGSPVIAMLGDSGLLFSVAELATVREHELPIVTIVFNNGSLGSIRDSQLEEYGRAIASSWETPDFVDLSRAFGLTAERVADLAALPAVVAKAVASCKPHVIEVVAPFRSPWSYIAARRD